MADVDAPGEVFRLLTDPDGPMTLKELAKLWAVPRGRFVEWFTTEHAGLYDAALKVRADELAHGALEIADGCEKDFAPVAKLQVDTRLRLASRWDRARYGEQVQHNVAVEPFAAMLKRVSERKLAEKLGAPALGLMGPVEDAVVLPALEPAPSDEFVI